MDLQFDEKGHLVPYSLISMNWDTFIENFALRFDKSSSRYKLIETLEVFLSKIITLVPTHFEVWINGSFATLKPNPNDIDIVLLIKKSYIDKVLMNFIQLNQTQKGRKIDAYMIELFDEKSTDFVFRNGK